MPDARSRPERPPAERLPLGAGEPPPRRRSRHAPPLGGRGPRPGVHDARRPPPVRASRPGAARRRPPHRRHRRPRAASATRPDRLNAAYRRRYGELHGDGPDSGAIVPEGERDAFREHGPPPRRGARAPPRRSGHRARRPSARRVELAGDARRARRRATASRSATRRLDVRRGAPAVPRRAAARRPAARRQRRRRRRSCTTPRPGCSTGCCSRSSPPTPTAIVDDDDASPEANA